ncbi:MAG: thiamine pyrophosphate-dependent enzyme [Chloroflexi bacterium]|nr:thiamine pyrophosphate-dependent enzyme [Chloroflexota bacterium]
MSESTGMQKVKVVGSGRVLRVPQYGCPGCQHPLVGRIIAEVLEEMDLDDRAIQVAGIGCNSGTAMLNLDVVQGSHGGAPDMATAIKRLSPDSLVFTSQGDGDCIAIGAGSFIGALTRGEMITIIMFNNANYGTTGGQLAPTTIMGQKTTTTPDGREGATSGYPVHVAELAATFRGVAYSARGAFTTPANYQRTRIYIKAAFQKQVDRAGLSFVEVLSACPPNWHLTPVESVKWIEANMIPEFPLGEFKNVERVS